MSRRSSPSFAVGGVSWLASDGRVSRLNDPTPTGWRCYHCNEHFRDPNAAFRHFGAPATKPGEHPPTACTTPSQGLDAATVEPISDTDVIAFASQFYDEKDKGMGAETRRWIRAVRAALATDPHQHGGKGA